MSKDRKPKPLQASKAEQTFLPEVHPVIEGNTPHTQPPGLTAPATSMIRQNGLMRSGDSASLRDELTITELPSLLDLALAESMDAVSQTYKTEMLPGEIRVWKNTFAGEKPEAIRWAFRQYFKQGQFPPKPADIALLIRQNRESPYFDGWDADIRKVDTSRTSEIYRQKAQESRQEFFKSPEYQQFLERMKREHGI